MIQNITRFMIKKIGHVK